jgi:hypothetical protein
MSVSRTNNFSFIIHTNGEIMLTAPEDREFSPQQIRDYVAGPPELFCRTHDGFFLFHNKEAKALGLLPNDLATSMYLRQTPPAERLLGKIFVAHPDHLPPSWKSMSADEPENPRVFVRAAR